MKLQRILQNVAELTVIANSCCITMIPLLALEMQEISGCRCPQGSEHHFGLFQEIGANKLISQSASGREIASLPGCVSTDWEREYHGNVQQFVSENG